MQVFSRDTGLVTGPSEDSSSLTLVTQKKIDRVQSYSLVRDGRGVPLSFI
jgi:hypothetical protein